MLPLLLAVAVAEHAAESHGFMDYLFSALKCCVQLITLMYPSYKTFKALESRKLADAHTMLVYWAVFAFVNAWKEVCDETFGVYASYTVWRGMVMLLKVGPLVMGPERMYKYIVEPLWEREKETIDPVVSELHKIRDQAKEEIVEPLKDRATETFEPIKDAMQEQTSSISEKINDTVESVKETIVDAAESVGLIENPKKDLAVLHARLQTADSDVAATGLATDDDLFAHLDHMTEGITFRKNAKRMEKYEQQKIDGRDEAITNVVQVPSAEDSIRESQETPRSTLPHASEQSVQPLNFTTPTAFSTTTFERNTAIRSSPTVSTADFSPLHPSEEVTKLNEIDRSSVLMSDKGRVIDTQSEKVDNIMLVDTSMPASGMQSTEFASLGLGKVVSVSTETTVTEPEVISDEVSGVSVKVWNAPAETTKTLDNTLPSLDSTPLDSTHSLDALSLDMLNSMHAKRSFASILSTSPSQSYASLKQQPIESDAPSSPPHTQHYSSYIEQLKRV